MSAIEDLLAELETGSDDDRSVAHACRVELDAAAAANAEHERFVADVLHIRGEIEWLGVENERLRGALTDLLELAKQYLNETGGCDHSVNICVCDIKGHIEEARAALAPKETK